MRKRLSNDFGFVLPEVVDVRCDVGGLTVEHPIADYLPDLKEFQTETEELLSAAKQRAAWHKAGTYTEPLCDLKDHVQLHCRKFGFYVSTYKRTPTGYALTEIKQADNVKLFANKACQLIYGLFRMRCDGGWCIITTPKRRHKENHFSTMVCEEMSTMLGIPFDEDFLEAENRQRINPTFNVMKSVSEKNIILYDDILTTGSTIEASVAAFSDRNIAIIIGVSNT